MRLEGQTGLGILAIQETEEMFRSEETVGTEVFWGDTGPKPPSQLNCTSVLMENNDLGSLRCQNHSFLPTCVPHPLDAGRKEEREGEREGGVRKNETHPRNLHTKEAQSRPAAQGRPCALSMVLLG